MKNCAIAYIIALLGSTVIEYLFATLFGVSSNQDKTFMLMFVVIYVGLEK